MSSTTQCPVCCEDYTKKLRREVKCETCSYSSCLSCVKRYVVDSLTPHCMNCKHHWDRNRQYELFGASFVNIEYRKHRTILLFDQEKAKIPSTQADVDHRLEIEKQEAHIEILHAKVREYRVRVQREQRRLYELKNEAIPLTTERNLLKCPGNGCLGYIEGKKCKICKSTVCRDCLTVIDSEEHVCNEDQLKTAQFIMSETKPCPACGTRISKVNGCDQMWCTECNTAFSWRTNKQIHGVVHNPHYFQWLSEGGQNPGQRRTPGDIVCGGLTNVTRHVLPQKYRNLITVELRHTIQHIQTAKVQRQREVLTIADPNKKERINFILNRTTEEIFKRSIIKADNLVERSRASLYVYEMFVTVATERYNDLMLTLQNPGDLLPSSSIYDPEKTNQAKEEFITKKIEEFRQLIEYTNTHLEKVQKNYKVGTLKIDPTSFKLMY